MVLTLSFRPGLVVMGAIKRLCIIIRHVALRWDDPRRREVSYCFIASVGISGGSHRWVSVCYNHRGARSMGVPERHAEGDAARADQLDILFVNGVLIDEK